MFQGIFIIQSAGEFPHQPCYNCPASVLPFSITVRYRQATGKGEACITYKFDVEQYTGWPKKVSHYR